MPSASVRMSECEHECEAREQPPGMRYLFPMLPDAPMSHVCCAQVTIVEADDRLYAATIDDVVAMKLGPRSWSPADCLPVPSAKQFACRGLF